MGTAVAEPSVEETLSWEAEQRPRAGAAAIAAAVLTLVGDVLLSRAYTDLPSVTTVDALRDAAGQGSREGLRAAQVRYLDGKAVELVVPGVLLALGALAMAAVLGYLYRATKARRGAVPRFALYAGLIGPALVAVGGLLYQVVLVVNAHGFVTGDDTGTQAARDALGGSVILVGQVLRQFGIFALALAFVVIALNAMRAGLLTRFMGILGIIVGALFILPIGSSLPIVQCFWLLAVGVLILGRWPGPGTPPAWATGRAEPWPTQQQMRERSDAARSTGEVVEPTAPAPARAGGASSASKKRKRKRR